ncbi:MAG: hypothetical protein KAU28_03435 [Phycisphaerae bacterium]|nr:hypothetical protein [Phycisphaerae bacterium]
MKCTLKTVASQPSWVIRSKAVELTVTQLGGHMAPVTFYRDSKKPVQPYYINPWHSEGLKIDEPVIVPLRGDLFCMPFGANVAPYRGEKHPVHGETACNKWRLVDAGKCGGITTLTLSIKTKLRPGKATKRLSMVDGQNVIYCQHVLEGFSGAMSLGHHPTLAMPAKLQTVRIVTSPIRYGMTNPAPSGDPAEGSYYSLAVNKRFRSLKRVPLIWQDQPVGDCTTFPTRVGYTDILAVFNKPSRRPAWTTAAFEEQGYMWFSLKDAQVLPTTLLWISNRGRHGLPWNGRNCCLGLEDICGYFAEGIAPSLRENCLTKDGIATAIKFSPKKATVINHIQGVAKIPRGFGKVRTAKFATGKVTFVSATGKKMAVALRHSFLQTGKL